VLRALRTQNAERIEGENADGMGELGRVLELYFGGDMEASIALSGQVVGRIDEVVPVERILSETVQEFFAVAKEMGQRAEAEAG
jgi:enoyl-[acyl-carrier protein] reductase II